jgi:hypothetical protein
MDGDTYDPLSDALVTEFGDELSIESDANCRLPVGTFDLYSGFVPAQHPAPQSLSFRFLACAKED